MKLLQEPFTAEYAEACLLLCSDRQGAEGNIIILKSLKKSCLGVLCDLCGEYMASRILISGKHEYLVPPLRGCLCSVE